MSGQCGKEEILTLTWNLPSADHAGDVVNNNGTSAVNTFGGFVDEDVFPVGKVMPDATVISYKTQYWIFWRPSDFMKCSQMTPTLLCTIKIIFSWTSILKVETISGFCSKSGWMTLVFVKLLLEESR